MSLSSGSGRNAAGAQTHGFSDVPLSLPVEETALEDGQIAWLQVCALKKRGHIQTSFEGREIMFGAQVPAWTGGS
jgi:hypothetical protein